MFYDNGVLRNPFIAGISDILSYPRISKAIALG